MSTDTWSIISWPAGYINNNLDMPLKDRPSCLACKVPLRKAKEVEIEGTIRHRARHLCEKCYTSQLDSGVFHARVRAEQTDTHIKCKKCGKFKPFEKFKRLTGTFRVGRDYTCSLCRKLWERYKLTYLQYSDFLEKQDYKCAICKVDFEEEDNRSIHVDHDHLCCSKAKSCGKCVRGLLCGTCNSGIGLLKDSPKIIKEALLYLEGYYETTTN